MAELQVFFEKVVTYNIDSLLLCASKDLLAIQTEGDSMVVLRISHQPKKVTTLDETVKISSISFKQDGKAIVLANTDGFLKVFSLESLRLTLFQEVKMHNFPIPYLKWLSFPRHFSKPVFPVEQHFTLERFSHEFEDFSVITAVDQVGFVSMTVNGVYPLALFSEPGCKAALPNDSISKMWVLANLNDRWKADLWDIQVIDKKSKEIFEVSEVFYRCQEYFKVLGKATREVVNEINTICEGYSSRYLKGIEDSIKKTGQLASIEEVLCLCAATGVVSPALKKFLQDEMQNSKAISQYEEKIAVQVKNAQIVLIKDVKNSILTLIFYLNTLNSFASVPSYAPLNLAQLNLLPLIEKLREFLEKTLATTELLSEAHSDIKNMVHWLHNWNLKTSKEEEPPEAPEEWPVSLKQLMVYLEDPEKLYFTSLTKITKKEFLSDFNLILHHWQETVQKVPLGFPKYFRKIRELQLSQKDYKGHQVEICQDRLLIALFDLDQIDFFQISGETVSSYSIKSLVLIKHVKVCKDGKFVVAGSNGTKGSLLYLDSSGSVIAKAEFLNEEVSALGFSDDRMIAVLVTNERTLRMFDLNEI